MKQKQSQSPEGKKLLITLLARPQSNLAHFDPFLPISYAQAEFFSPRGKVRQKREAELSPVCSSFIVIIPTSESMYC